MPLLTAVKGLHGPLAYFSFALIGVGVLVAFLFLHSFSNSKWILTVSDPIHNYARFIWNCFFKPHSGDGTRNQQDALESFYKSQASIYDGTRARLLSGRKDMLGLVAAQLKYRVETGLLASKPVWVDVSFL